MVKEQGQMFLTGPDIVKAATGEDATAEDIGGIRVHTGVSGVAHLEVDSEEEAFHATRLLLSFLPTHKGGPQRRHSPVPPTRVPSSGFRPRTRSGRASSST